jgi:peptidoglycan/xylan/chitin deacetylase (PgdA/CDA1 family)
VRLRRLVSRRRPDTCGRGLVLLYHRVTAADLDPQLLCVAPERFTEHLEVLQRLTAVVPLDRIREAADSERSVPVAVTFDDGYADNLLEAAPLLEIPATFFVVSGQVGAGSEFWWDRVERALFEPDELPDRLELAIGPETVRFDFADGRVRDRTWNVLRDDTPSPRQAAYRELTTRLRPLDPIERDEAVDELSRWSGVPADVRASHRPLTETELRRLDAHPNATVGAHTVTHPVLAALSRRDQRIEVTTSKQQLEEFLGHGVASFSYPYGGHGDFSRASVSAVTAAGFELACANFEGRVGPKTDRFRLPRMLVRDWSGDEFERRLRAWMGT